jgi:tetratricopeptide (TPR) repeat protein
MKKENREIRDLIQSGQLPQAFERLNAILVKTKRNPELIVLEGLYYAQAGDYDRALQAFAVASKSRPHDQSLFYNLAVVLRNMGRLKAADEAIQKSLRIKPLNNPLALFEQAQIKTLQGKDAEAIQILFGCIEKNGLFFPAYIALENYLTLMGQKAIMEKIYRAASEQLPDEVFFKQRLLGENP